MKDMTGMVFGKLKVIERAEHNSKSGNAMWKCKCDCGNIITVIGSHLRSGHTTSCGCNRISDIAQGYSDTRLYRIWVNMHNRCYKKNHDAFRWYGAKGIAVCTEWHEFIPFMNWALSNGYQEDLSIDRIDSRGSYEPSNCRWQTQKQQMNNVSSNRIILFEGQKFTLSQFSEHVGLSYCTVTNRLRLGWPLERIADTPEVSS